MKSLAKVLVGLALSALTLVLFFRNLDLDKVRHGLANASLPLLLASIVIGYFVHLLLRARRWATMLQPLKENVSFYNLYSTTAIGYAISWLTPGRLGEVIRPVLLARREGISSASSIATVGLERMLDAATILVLAASSALSAPFWSEGRQQAVLRTAAWLGAFGLVACAAGILILRHVVREGSWFLRLADRRRSASGGLGAKLWGFARSLAEGASFLTDSRRLALVAAQSLLLWATIGLAVWVGLLAAGVRVPFAGVFLLLAVSAIGIAVPTPGGTGTVHYAFQQGLIQIFGVEANLAAVATVLYHPVIVYIPPVVVGLLFAWKDGLTPKALRSLARGSGVDSKDAIEVTTP